MAALAPIDPSELSVSQSVGARTCWHQLSGKRLRRDGTKERESVLRTCVVYLRRLSLLLDLMLSRVKRTRIVGVAMQNFSHQI